MNSPIPALTFSVEPPDNKRLAALCGEFDHHLKKIADYFDVHISNRGPVFSIKGSNKPAQDAQRTLQQLYAETNNSHMLNDESVFRAMREVSENGKPPDDEAEPTQNVEIKVRTPKKQVRPRSVRQYQYVESILTDDVVFGVGPAGTGKTYLAVACAVQALVADEVQRIVLVRPAVEAGERLGFLPGDIGQKVDPYLRPLYDALYELLGFDRVGRLLDKNVIELAPLAYMRGRTLGDAYVILDEAQNTTIQQMKMFLTRIGFGSKAVITGDITQTDLPHGTVSGLRHAVETLNDIKGIAVTHFRSSDVVRHPLVQRIIEAYDARKDEGK